MTSNFTAAELRELAKELGSEFPPIGDAIPVILEYAALKEAAEKGVTDEVVEIACAAADYASGLDENVFETLPMRAALIAVAPLLTNKETP